MSGAEIGSLNEFDDLYPEAPDEILPAKEVFVIYYNQTITGSKELRAYNKKVVSECYPEPEEGSPLHYYSKYDSPGGKSNEPFYDAFLVHMATLDASKHEEYGLVDIVYYEEQYTRVEENTGQESLFKKTFARADDGTAAPHKTRVDLNYNRAKHIFLLCPTAEYMVDDIVKLINDDKHSDTPIIIHIQGDIKNMTEGDKTTESVNNTINQRCAMNSPEGMFRDAFNLYSGGEDHRLLRKALHELGAMFLSASPEFDESNASDNLKELRIEANKEAAAAAAEAGRAEAAANAAKEKVAAPKGRLQRVRRVFRSATKDAKAKQEEAEAEDAFKKAKEKRDRSAEAANVANTPLYYRKANNDILMLSATEVEKTSVYEKLTNNENTLVEVTNKEQAASDLKITKILKVYQDGTDKDNLAGLILLGAAYTGTEKPIDLDFIGLRIYISTTVPFPSKEHTFSFPFTEGGLMREGGVEEFFQPGDNRPNQGNIKFQSEFTTRFYTAQLEGFKQSLIMSTPDMFIFNNSKRFFTDYIVDGVNDTSKSLRAPFNMSLFFWAPETYMAKAIIMATDSYTGDKKKFTFNKTDYDKAMSRIKGVPADTVVPTKVGLVIEEGGKRKRRTRKNKKYNKKSKKHHKKRSYKKQQKKTNHKRRTHKRR